MNVARTAPASADLCTCSPSVSHVQSPLIDVEHQLLATLLVRPELLDEVPGLEIYDFARPQHRLVFEVMRNLQARGEAPSVENIDGYLVAYDEVRGTVCRLHAGRSYLKALLRTDWTPDVARTGERVRAWAALLRKERWERELAQRVELMDQNEDEAR